MKEAARRGDLGVVEGLFLMADRGGNKVEGDAGNDGNVAELGVGLVPVAAFADLIRGHREVGVGAVDPAQGAAPRIEAIGARAGDDAHALVHPAVFEAPIGEGAGVADDIALETFHAFGVGEGFAEVRVGATAAGEHGVDVEAVGAEETLRTVRVAVVTEAVESGFDEEVVVYAVFEKGRVGVVVEAGDGVGWLEVELFAGELGGVGNVGAGFAVLEQAEAGADGLVGRTPIVEVVVGRAGHVDEIVARADAGDAGAVGAGGGHTVVGRGAVPIGGLVDVVARVERAVLQAELALKADLGLARETVGAGEVHALALVVVVVAVAGGIFGESVEPQGKIFRDRAVEVDGAAPAAVAIDAEIDAVGRAVEARALGPRGGDAAGAAVAEEHAVGAAGELVAFGVVGVALDIPEEVIPRGEGGAHIAVVDLETAGGGGVDVELWHPIERPLAGAAEIGRAYVVEKLARHYGNRGRGQLERGIGAATGERAGGGVADVVVGAHFEGGEEDGFFFRVGRSGGAADWSGLGAGGEGKSGSEEESEQRAGARERGGRCCHGAG